MLVGIRTTGAADVDAGSISEPTREAVCVTPGAVQERAGIRMWRVQESAAVGPSRAEGGCGHHACFVLHRAPERTPRTSRVMCSALRRLLSPRESPSAAALDLPIDPDEPGLALDALLTAWPDADGRAPFDALPELASVAEMTRLRFESLETPPQLLRD